MKTKTVLHEGYEAPQCKVYRITVESVIAGSPDSTENPHDDGDENF